MASRAIPRVSISILAAATLVVATVGSGSAQSPSAGPAGPLPTSADGSLERVQQNGLYVGFAGENPWSFIAPDGTFQGAEAEMVLACAPKLGITEVYPVGLVFDGLLPALQARRIDMTAAGQSIREARLQVAIATQLLYRYGTRIVGMKGDPVLQTLNSWTKAGEAGVEIAGIRGSTELTDTAQFGVKWLEYPDNPTELADLLAGRIKYMAWNDNYFSQYIKENPDAPIEAVKDWDYQGVVSLPGHYFNSEDVGLRDAFNECYSELKTSGQMAQILEKWGFNPDTIPEPGPGYPPGFPEG